MTTALLRMINSRGDALERIAGLDLAGPAEVLPQARRIVVVGTGTSLHAAELGAMMLAKAGRDAYAYPAAAWARWGTGPRATDAVCVITHTAGTAYAARSRADALAAGVPVVSVTGTGRGWPEAIETVAPDESHTYSVSYTATLAVLARLAHALGSPEGAPDQLALATAQVRRACADPGPDRAGHLAEPRCRPGVSALAFSTGDVVSEGWTRCRVARWGIPFPPEWKPARFAVTT